MQLKTSRRKNRRTDTTREKQLKSIMHITDPNFWIDFEKACDDRMSDWCENEENTCPQHDADIERIGKGFTETVHELILNELIKQPKTNTLKNMIKSDTEITGLKIERNSLSRRIKRLNPAKGSEIRKRYSKVKKILKKKLRILRNNFMREAIKEIEKDAKDNPKRYWRELKRIARWKRTNHATDTVLDSEGNEVRGEQTILVWEEAYKRLGVEDLRDPKFDTSYAQKVTEEVEQIEEETHRQEEIAALDRNIHIEEIRAAIKELKRGKTPGVDFIVAEVLKHGGKHMSKALLILCRHVWNREQIPSAWTKGIIFPIYKDGEERDTNNYRGITLLSIVGKVYTTVLNRRLIDWCEKKGILVEEQGGFRPERGCPDQLFVITEILKQRKEVPTYACFIDVKKAFDRVWRNGLWKRLAEEGIRGKMWRAIRTVYSKVQSAVLTGVGQTNWFDINTGVRQGCVLSPVLFAIFINGLAKEIRNMNKGVKIANTDVSLLLYADDIVLMSESREALQDMMNTLSEYSKKWRFELNQKKSEVVIFGTPRAKKKAWWLAGKEVKQVLQYKYLGIELTRHLKWYKYKKRILEKARKRMIVTQAMGIKSGYLSVRAASNIWEALVRPILEYGAEVWGEDKWEEAEKLQREMGRRILKCSETTANEVVLGELGWWPLEARRDLLRLKYWRKLIKVWMRADWRKRYTRIAETNIYKETTTKHGANIHMNLCKTWD
jgi:hypothetical protein